MSRTIKTFRMQRGTQADPIPFELEFVPTPEALEADPDATPEVHSFKAWGEAPAGLTLVYGSTLQFNNRGETTVNVNGMTAFFEAAMMEEDYRRFRKCIDSPHLMVEMEALGEIFQWLAAEYFERPTRRSSASGGGRPQTGDSLTELPRSAVEVS